MKRLNPDKIPELIQQILTSDFWLHTLSTTKFYTRTHDDCDGDTSQKLCVGFTPDGDGWIQTRSPTPLRFRMPGQGGGLSPRTRVALLILAEAIRLDNEDRPLA